ncbi:hypothetical protein [Streptomyces sp. WP-1]|uniref:hypothetical protein n=1 Tax=Streptomyces sp. WP-1 TaxID=3041497 RepID=UPI0026478072|nr:hypothetical protein [Streptomyces sp. WP-1]WKE67858.1 hypothetical protein QHG49_01860 [Streptomyces sp. WP-1]
MPIPVHALAHRPLTVEAVAELVALPYVSPVDEGDEAAVEAELRRRGRQSEDLVCESFRTGHGHVLCSDAFSPFGELKARAFLVFGELYPVGPDDEGMVNGTWLNGYMEGWEQLPGWRGLRPATGQDCETVLARAAGVVAEVIGAAPERALVSAHTTGPGPALTHRVWRTPAHALILGPRADEGPYGYLTHLQLSSTPLTCASDLSAATTRESRAIRESPTTRDTPTARETPTNGQIPTVGQTAADGQALADRITAHTNW